MYTPYTERQKWLPWQRPFVAGYWQYLHFVRQPLKPPSITNCLVVIVHTAILVPKLVVMTFDLGYVFIGHLDPENPPRESNSYHTTKIIAYRKPKIG